MTEFPNCNETCPCRCKTDEVSSYHRQITLFDQSDPGDENDYKATVEFMTEFAPYELTSEIYKLERHPSSQAFHDRMDEYKTLHDKKQLDYGSDDDPFANIRAGAKKLGLPAWIGAVLRMNDKIERLNKAAKQYIETGEISLANEGVLDSFDDLAVYSGIGAVVFNEETDRETT